MAEQDPRNDHLASQLAEIEEKSAIGQAGNAPDTTVTNLKAELDTMAGNLLGGKKKDQFEDESACGRVTDLVAAIGHDPEDVTIDSVAGNTEAAEKSAEPALGTIGQYEIITKLGEGGMGAVYQARHTKLDKIVAIKVLPAERMKDKSAVARFEREMRAVGKLEHPNIVRAMDAGEVDGMHFLVMEYVKGRDLSQLVKQHGPLPIAEACEMIRQAAVGLDEAFDNNMVHRDIKPSNLILASRRRKPPVVKILDMGLALLSDAHSADAGLTTTGQMMGTLDYMAPEQGGDSKNVDIRADIYALGASLYRLLCGEVIYHGDKYSTPVQKMMALAVAPAPAIQDRREGIPDELAAIVHRMLEKDPDNRYATPQEIADDLAPFCAGADLGWLLTGERSATTEPTDASLSATELGASSSEVDTNVDTGGSPVSEVQLTSPSADPSAVTIAPAITTVGAAKPPAAKPQVAARRKIPTNMLIAGGAGLLGIVALLGAIVFFLQTPNGTLRVEINDPTIKVQLEGTDITFTQDKQEPITIKPGNKTLIVTRDDFTFETNQFVLKKGETTVVKVDLLPGKVQVVSAGNVIGSQSIDAGGKKITTNFALAFDGEKSYVSIDSIGYPLADDWTIEATIAVKSLKSSDEKSRAVHISGPDGRIGVGANSAGKWNAGTSDGKTNLFIDSDVDAKLGQTFHIATVFQKNSLKLFVNGKLVGTQESQGSRPADSPVRTLLGAEFYDGEIGNHLSGYIDEVRISKIARYGGDFKPVDSNHRFDSDRQTLALYHFNEGSGDVLKDSSGNNHHGKIVGAKWVRVENSAPTNEDRSSGLKFSGDGWGVTTELPSVPGGGEFTFELWATPARNSGKVEVAGAYGKDRNLRKTIQFVRHSAGREWEFYSYHADVRAPLEWDRRVHLAGVVSGAELVIFVDGKRASARPYQIGPGDFDFLNIGGPGFEGVIDELRFSKAARYTEDFTPPQRFAGDEKTIALYHFDEGTGDVLKDSSGNNHHGKIVGAKWERGEGEDIPPSVSPPIDQALRFDEAATVELPKFEFDLNEPLTLEFWARAEQSPPRKQKNVRSIAHCGSFDIKQSPGGHWQGGISTKGELEISRAGYRVFDSDLPAEAGKWTHVAACWRGKEYSLFVDGKQQRNHDTVADAKPNAAGLLGQGFSGDVTELRVSKICRYTKEFVPARTWSDDADTLALYHFDEGTGDVLKDSSGNNHDGKIVGAKWVRVDSTSQTPEETRSEDGAPRRELEIGRGGSVSVEDFQLGEMKNFTLELYVTPSAEPTAHKGYQALFSVGKTRVLAVTPEGETNFIVKREGGNNLAIQGPALSQGQRVHIAAVGTPDDLRLFVAGKLVQRKQLAEPLAAVGSSLVLGQFFNGRIDELRISTVARYDKDFTPPARHEPDQSTLALYHCDDGDGDVLKDSSGNHHHGKIVGAKWVKVDDAATKQQPYALEFDGEDSRAMVSDLKLDSTSKVTIEAWINCKSGTPDKTSMIASLGERSRDLMLRGEENSMGINTPLARGPQTISNGRWVKETLVLGRWQHVAGVWNGDHVALYVDGRKQTEGTYDEGLVDVSGALLLLGGKRSSGQAGFHGLIREFRVSGTSRYAENFVPPLRFGPDDQTVALYHCDEGEGDVLKDSSGNHHHGKIVGAKWVRVDPTD